MDTNDLRMKSWINSFNKQQQQDLKNNTVDLDSEFSDSGGSEPTTPVFDRRAGRDAFRRSPSISFANEDEIMEYTKGGVDQADSSMEVKRGIMKQLSKSSFDWDFSDEAPGEIPLQPLDPNRGITRNNSQRKIFFAVGEEQDSTTFPSLPRRKNARSSSSLSNSFPEGLNRHLGESEIKDDESEKLIPEADSSIPEIVPSKANAFNSSPATPPSPPPPVPVNGTGPPADNFTGTAPLAEPEKIPTKYLSPYAEEEDEFDKKKDAWSSLNSLKRYASKSSLISTMDNVKDRLTVANLKEQTDKRKLNVVVAFFFLVVVLFIAAAHVVYYKHIGELRLFGHLKLEEADRRLLIFDQVDKLILESRLAVTLPGDIHPYPCIDPSNLHHGPHGGSKERCLEWKGLARLRIQHQTDTETSCYRLSWQSLHPDVSPMDCFPADDEIQGHWYGGGESLNAAWPLENGRIKNTAFVTGDEGRTEWGNVIRKYFLNSRGLSVTIEDHTPLFISLNQPKFPGLCLQAKFDDFSYFYHRFDLPRLNYTVCTDNDLNHLHKQFLPSSFWDGHSQDDLDTLHHLLKKPIWQVPAFSDLSHDKLVSYIERVVGETNDSEDRGYILLNYHWQANMGDFSFNKKAFPDLKETLEFIKKSGLKLVLTINPFVSTESSNFQTGVTDSYFVLERNSTNSVPALTWFKDVTSAGLLDITRNRTVNWLQSQLRALSVELNDEAVFFVDSGNTFHTPTYFQFKKALDNPDMYRDVFVNAVMDQVPVIGVSGAASQRPKAPAFVFLTPLESNWTHLQSVIPNVLHLSVIGYPFTNPGPVGGIGRSMKSGNIYPLEEELELYIRWWQLNTFMPMLHFFKPPSAFPPDLIAATAKDLQKIRNEVVMKYLVKFSNSAMKNSQPVIRPLWVLDPKDPIAQTINDEFLIGDSLLVAPVLKLGARTRDVYLPNYAGHDDTVWMRGSDKRYFKGGRWMNNTKADLDEVLYFIREDDGSLPTIG